MPLDGKAEVLIECRGISQKNYNVQILMENRLSAGINNLVISFFVINNVTIRFIITE